MEILFFWLRVCVCACVCVCVCRHLADADGVEVLVQLLTDPMSECRQFAAQSITSMATDGETHGSFTTLYVCNHCPLPTNRVLSLSV